MILKAVGWQKYIIFYDRVTCLLLILENVKIINVALIFYLILLNHLTLPNALAFWSAQQTVLFSSELTVWLSVC